jgi:hypothetical protein
MPFGLSSGFDVADLGALDAVGVSSEIRTAGASLTFQVSVAGVGASVTIRFEGSLDGESYFGLDSSGDQVITEDGVTGYFLQAPVKHVRVRLVAIDGGTPTVSCLIGCA